MNLNCKESTVHKRRNERIHQADIQNILFTLAQHMNENNRLLKAFMHDAALQSLHGLLSCPQQKHTTGPNSNGPTGTDRIPSLQCHTKFFFILFICFHVFLPVINLKNEFPKCLCLCPREEVDPAACFREAVPEKHTEHVFGGGSVQL